MNEKYFIGVAEAIRKLRLPDTFHKNQLTAQIFGDYPTWPRPAPYTLLPSLHSCSENGVAYACKLHHVDADTLSFRRLRNAHVCRCAREHFSCFLTMGHLGTSQSLIIPNNGTVTILATTEQRLFRVKSTSHNFGPTKIQLLNVPS